MDNKIKESFDNIKTPEDLKNETFRLMKEKRKVNKIKVILNSSISVAAVALICLGITTYNLKYKIDDPTSPNIPTQLAATEIEFNMEGKDLNRFKDFEELRDFLKDNAPDYTYRDNYDGALVYDSVSKGETSDLAMNSAEQSVTLSTSGSGYSKTNTQEANVDEADIIKTDGKYIYYITRNSLYIVNCDTMKIETQKELDDTDVLEMYLKDDKLVLFLNTYKSKLNIFSKETEDVAYHSYENYCEVRVYNISDPQNIVKERSFRISGLYQNSRMIGDTVYFISTKNAYYRDQIKEKELLPTVYDNSEKAVISSDRVLNICEADCTNYSFTTICAFDINKEEKAQYETFLGYTSNIYMTEKSMYLTKRYYDNDNYKEQTQIYRFDVNKNGIKYKSTGLVNGHINNQFSLSEYDNNLRIVTTENNHVYNRTFIDDFVAIKNITETKTVPEMTNTLYVLDENLNEIGKLENFGLDEKVYSARFIGKIGYVVTFKQTDPLFVIDLSDPTKPEIKGELKIPGYSSYLHPFDETHIIGFGKNTEENEWGGTITTTIKVSMFDISDLNNPQEVFNKTIGFDNSYSDLEYNHKVLFENKEEGLIGLPYSTYENYRHNSKAYNGIMILKPNFDNNEFEEYFSYLTIDNYWANYINRIIYVGNYIYAAGYDNIAKFDIHNDKEPLDILKLEVKEKNYLKIDVEETDDFDDLFIEDDYIEDDYIEDDYIEDEESTTYNY